MLDYGKYSAVADYPQDGDNPLAYEHLEGDWALFYKVARYFIHKVKFEDREDFLHDTMLEMAKVKAKYEVTEYWHTLMRYRPTILSLNERADGDGSDGDGEAGEVMDFLADDKAIDIVARLDARRFLLGCPRRLIQIAYKRYSGLPLDNADKLYLGKWRKKNDQKRLID